MGMAQHSRTTGHPTVGRAWTPSRGTRVVPIRDSPALTALRVATYVLASVTCLAILVMIVYATMLLREFPQLTGGAAR